MQIHLVGGFLGSGKTTAIIGAAKRLVQRGMRVGVITNDQGKYLVDTAFFLWNKIPAVEVTGGCFCCNYDDLDIQIDRLVEQMNPDAIFAESVGSCGDLVSTVVRPLMELKKGDIRPASFTVFTDARLLELRLEGEDLPFSENVIYIFDKQIEEAPVLVLNKADLLTQEQNLHLQQLVQARYPGKAFRPMNSLDEAQVGLWVDTISSQDRAFTLPSIEMDYSRYSAGEASLAWLDEEIQVVTTRDPLSKAIQAFLTDLLERLSGLGAGIGHLKVLVKTNGNDLKLSFTALPLPGWETSLSTLSGKEASLLINARVELEPEVLHNVVKASLDAAALRSGVSIREIKVDCFRPGVPRPQHRI